MTDYTALLGKDPGCRCQALSPGLEEEARTMMSAEVQW